MIPNHVAAGLVEVYIVWRSCGMEPADARGVIYHALCGLGLRVRDAWRISGTLAREAEAARVPTS